LGSDTAQWFDQSEQRRLQHRALGQIDQGVPEPLAKSHDHWRSRIAGPAQADPRPAASRRYGMQRRDDGRIDSGSRQGGLQCAELDRAIIRDGEMLQRAAAALAEMTAGRCNASRARRNALEDPAFVSRTSARTDLHANAVARHRERNVDRRATLLGDAVTLSPEPFDRELRRIGRAPRLLRRRFNQPTAVRRGRSRSRSRPKRRRQERR
jgi:hypothetical protein